MLIVNNMKFDEAREMNLNEFHDVLIVVLLSKLVSILIQVCSFGPLVALWNSFSFL